MSRAIDGDRLFEYIQKEKAWKQFTIKRPRYDKGKQDAYYEMLEIIQEQPTLQPGSWIPVSERLPEEYKKVLAISTDKDIPLYFVAKLINGKWKVAWNHDEIVKIKIIAWQPLPESYKEVENEYKN